MYRDKMAMLLIVVASFMMLAGCSMFDAIVCNDRDNQCCSNVVIRICGCDVPARAYSGGRDITVYEWDEEIWHKIETEDAARRGDVPSPPESVKQYNLAIEEIIRVKHCCDSNTPCAKTPLDAMYELKKAVELGYCNLHRFMNDPCIFILPCYDDWQRVLTGRGGCWFSHKWIHLSEGDCPYSLHLKLVAEVKANLEKRNIPFSEVKYAVGEGDDKAGTAVPRHSLSGD